MPFMRIFPALLVSLALSVLPLRADTSAGNRNGLSLEPDFHSAALNEGRGTLTFNFQNNSPDEIEFVSDYHYAVQLMTVDDSGNKVSIEDFVHGSTFDPNMWSHQVICALKPGVRETYVANFSMDTLAAVARRNKKIFGEITGHNTRSNQTFDACSTSFVIPPELTKPPWDDLGTQKYLSVTVDSSNPSIPDPRGDDKSTIPGIDYWGFLMFPIKITNVTARPYIVNSVHISFCRADKAGKAGPDLWELVRGLKPVPEWDEHGDPEPILKPGESTMAGGRSYITLWNDPDEIGWKTGDLMVVAVGGRIAGTNKVFECYSAPFKFPAIPTPR
jgi:hypothetical protein